MTLVRTNETLVGIVDEEKWINLGVNGYFLSKMVNTKMIKKVFEMKRNKDCQTILNFIKQLKHTYSKTPTLERTIRIQMVTSKIMITF